MESGLKVNFSKEQGCHFVELSGEISYNDAGDFQDKMEEALGAEESKIILDFSGVSYISSTGLRVLLKLGKEMAKQNRKLILCGLNEFTSSVFEVSGFNKIFNIKKDREEALKEA